MLLWGLGSCLEGSDISISLYHCIVVISHIISSGALRIPDLLLSYSVITHTITHNRQTNNPWTLTLESTQVQAADSDMQQSEFMDHGFSQDSFYSVTQMQVCAFREGS